MKILLLQLAKKWWIWVALVVFIVIVWQQMSSWAMSRKLYNMALDNLRTDQSRVVETLEENQKMYEAEIIRLSSEVENIRKQRTVAQAESERLRGLVNEKNNEIIALKRERDAIIIPTDPNILTDEFRKRGYSPRVILPSR